MAFSKSLHGAYKSALTNYPVTVQSIQTSALLGLGDFLCQTVVEGKSCDIDRTLRFGSVGFVIAPIVNKWGGFLEKQVVNKGFKSLVLKVAIDQCSFSPLMLAFGFSLQNIVKGRSLEVTKNNLVNNYFDILMSMFMVWPGVKIVNFSVVPLAYRTVIIQSVAVGWNAYLSWKLNGSQTRSSLTAIRANK